MPQTARTGSFGPVLGSGAGLEGSLREAFEFKNVVFLWIFSVRGLIIWGIMYRVFRKSRPPINFLSPQPFTKSATLTFYHGTSYRLGRGQHPLIENNNNNNNNQNLKFTEPSRTL